MKDDKRNNYPQHDFMMHLVVGDDVESIDVAVQRLFFALNFKSKLLGVTYLKEAIKLWYAFPSTKRVVLSSDVYLPVAEKLHSTPERVERAIRNAILDCFNHGKLVWFNDLVQSDVVSAKYPPTNGEFLSSVISWLRIECREHARQLTFLQYLEA